jgi:sphingomyelin phosphodiesterase
MTDGGLVTISRFPILESEFRPYTIGVFSDSISNKGVLYTKIMIKDQYLHLFNTHMNASYFTTNLDEVQASIDTREEQIELLRDFINVKI